MFILVMSLATSGKTHIVICVELLIERHVFEVIKNRIKEGRCPKCGTLIPCRFG